MDEIVTRVLNEPPRWCDTGYASTLLASAGITTLTHLAVRWISRRMRWWDSLDCDSRIVSTLNAAVMLYMYEPKQWWRDSSFDNVLGNSCQRDLCMISLVGYLIVDGALCAAAILGRQSKDDESSTPGSYADPLVFSHHALVATAFVVGIASRLATTFMAALIVNELSTPFVNFRVLIKNGPKTRFNDALYIVNGIALVTTYFFGRIAWIGFVVYRAAEAWRDLWRVGWIVGGYRLRVVVTLTFLLCGHFLINIVWFSKIVRHLVRIASGRRTKRN